MVCFVHQRQFCNKFHTSINQLRHLNEFSTHTLQQLPKRCCSCSKQPINVLSSSTKRCLTTMNIDVLRLMCLQYELEQYISVENLSKPSKLTNFILLPFPALLESKEQTRIINEFNARQDNIKNLIQHMQNVHLEFITSTTTKELLYELAQIKYILVSKCSTYFEAIQAINGLWMLISVENPSHFEIVKHVLEQQWLRFVGNIVWDYTQKTFNWRQDLPRNMIPKKIKTIQSTDLEYEEEYDTEEDEEEDVMDEFLISKHSSVKFRPTRLKNLRLLRSSRTHRRQNILFLATNI